MVDVGNTCAICKECERLRAEIGEQNDRISYLEDRAHRYPSPQPGEIRIVPVDESLRRYVVAYPALQDEYWLEGRFFQLVEVPDTDEQTTEPE